MAQYDDIIAQAMGDTRLSSGQRKYLQDLATGDVEAVDVSAPVVPEVPGMIPKGLTLKTPSGPVRYSADPSLDPTQKDQAVNVHNALQMGNDLASQLQIPRLIPDKIVQNIPASVSGEAGAVKMTPAERTIKGRVQYDPGTLADIQNAQIVHNYEGIPTLEESDAWRAAGRPALDSLQFGQGTPAMPMTDNLSGQYEQILNAGRSMRGEPVLSPAAIQSINAPINSVPMLADARTQFAQQAQSQVPPAIPDSPIAGLNIPSVAQYIPAALPFAGIPTGSQQEEAPVVAPVQAKSLPELIGPAAPKPITMSAVNDAVRAIGSKDKAMVGKWLSENGYIVE